MKQGKLIYSVLTLSLGVIALIMSVWAFVKISNMPATNPSSTYLFYATLKVSGVKLGDNEQPYTSSLRVPKNATFPYEKEVVFSVYTLTVGKNVELSLTLENLSQNTYSVSLENTSTLAKVSESSMLVQSYASQNGDTKGIATLCLSPASSGICEFKVKIKVDKAPVCDESNFLFAVVDGEVFITKYIGDESSVLMPNLIDNKNVYGLGDGQNAIFEGKTIEVLALPSTIKQINQKSLFGLDGVSVFVPSSFNELDLDSVFGEGSTVQVIK